MEMLRSNYAEKELADGLSNKLIRVSESMESINLRESQIRWFYREHQDKKWAPFNGFDSLRLENKYRAWECWHQRSSAGAEEEENNSTLKETKPFTLNADAKEGMNVSVLGGLYEVDVFNGVCAPIYWTAGKRPMKVLRGVWFRDSAGSLEPLEDEAVVKQLELEYIKLYSDGLDTERTFNSEATRNCYSPLNTQRNLHSTVSAPVLCTVSDVATEEASHLCQDLGNQDLMHTESIAVLPSTGDPKRKIPIRTIRFVDCHVDWYARDEMYLYQDSTSLYIRQKLGMQKVGTRIYRGYNQDAQPNDKPPDITHLCFVIHGIGQKMGTNPILKCCNDFRDMCNRLKCKYFPGLDAANQRVEFLPVEWRSSLQLDGDTVESITPVCVRGLRTTLNSSVMDIMYYNSPLYRNEISSSLLSELNRLYRMFCARNPRFESRGGKVSVIAHSLGCVLVYDLITGWSRPLTDACDQTASPNSNPTEAADAGEPQSNSTEHTRLNAETEMCTSKPIQTTEEDVQPTSLTPTTTSGPNFDSAQNLKRLAHVSSQLEAARTLVSRLEQELSELVQTRDKNGSMSSAFGDKQVAGNTPGLFSNPTDGADGTPTPCSYFTSNSLLFKSNLVNLFCLGSPLPVFLALRGIRPGACTNQDYIMPRRLCPRIFNIYHPADPVAYRLEPLVLKHYCSIQPALIHRADAVHKPDYDHMELVASSDKEGKRHRLSDCYRTEPDDTSPQKMAAVRKNDHGEPPMKQVNRQRSPSAPRGSFASRFLGFFRATTETVANPSAAGSSPPEANTETDMGEEQPGSVQDCIIPSLQLLSDELSDELDYPSPSETPVTTRTSETQIDSGSTINSLRLEHRMDFQLRASRYENMYISFLTSHTSYWTNVDVGMLIMTQLFGATHPPK